MTAVNEAPGREITPIARPALPKSGPAPKSPNHHPRTGVRAVWHSSIGKKYVMSVTGLLMLAFLVAHMLGNLKIFYGPRDFNDYAAYLRTIGTPILHGAWFLWISRFFLTIALGLHITAAYQLSRRDQQSRPIKYQHAQPVGGRYTTHTMRWGGLALLLFIIWHILDLSAGTVANGFQKGNVYGNVVHDFSHWYSNVIYIVAMIALGLHINHGFWSASMTMGYNRPARNKAIKAAGTILAVGISAGTVGYHFVQNDVYDNVVHDFSRWYENVIYIVAMVALGLHINHGFWSASMTLGYNRPKRNAAIKGLGTVLAVGIAGGFILVPVAVMTGLVS